MECVISYIECEMQRHLSTYIGTGSLSLWLHTNHLYTIYELLDSSISMIILCFYVTSRHTLFNIRVCISIFTAISKMMNDGKVISVESIELRFICRYIEPRYYISLSQKNININFHSRYIMYVRNFYGISLFIAI